MLMTFKRRIAEGFLVVTDVAGFALSASSAVVVAFLGKFMVAVVLGAVALGFILRLSGRRKMGGPVPLPSQMWMKIASATLSFIEVGLLVEATNFPVRFDQTGFAPWHWVLVLLALAIAYSLNLRLIGGAFRHRRATPNIKT
jgi:hypothetical protein